MRVARPGQDEKNDSRRRQHGQSAIQLRAGHSYNIICKWEPFREQLLLQWDRLTQDEMDAVGPNRSKIAVLIENRYGIASNLVENYLRNFERTLPLI